MIFWWFCASFCALFNFSICRVFSCIHCILHNANILLLVNWNEVVITIIIQYIMSWATPYTSSQHALANSLLKSTLTSWHELQCLITAKVHWFAVNWFRVINAYRMSVLVWLLIQFNFYHFCRCRLCTMENSLTMALPCHSINRCWARRLSWLISRPLMMSSTILLTGSSTLTDALLFICNAHSLYRLTTTCQVLYVGVSC